MDKKTKFTTETRRINGYLKEVVTFFDSSGKPISHLINPLMVELKPRDILQLFVGSFIISTPLCFTEEVWKISENLKEINIFLFAFLSIFTVSLYIYFNFYRFTLKGNIIHFFKRIIATYLVSISSVVLILSLIDMFPLMSNPSLAINRVVIIGFPSIFGAVLSDSMK